MAELTVLGGCGAWPEPGRACSGFLLSDDGYRVVLDLGYGSAARLLTHCPDAAVDAVIITHEHPDHCVDVSALARVRYYRCRDKPRLPLYCPPGVRRVLEALEPSVEPDEVFDIHDLPGPHTVGPFALTAVTLPHHVPNFGVRLESTRHAMAYTGDCGPAPALAELGRDVDLFIMDATLPEPPPVTGPRYVMAATEAATWAGRAGARRLLLTHFWPDSDRAAAVARAREVFGGEVLAADEDLVIRL